MIAIDAVKPPSSPLASWRRRAVAAFAGGMEIGGSHVREWGARAVMSRADPHLPEGVHEGTTILDKYRIGPTLGSGSMGTVVAAHHLHLDKRIAIKFLRSEAVGDHESRQRFFLEGRVADRIRSRFAVRVFDIATLPDGQPYIAMEYLEGCNLASWLELHGRLPIPQAVDFVLQACDALAEAHDLGVVHRDIKPSNLFVVSHPPEEPSIRLLDFGIAKSVGLLSSTLPPSACTRDRVVTEDGAIVGTLLYMSPEQLGSSNSVDERTDVWALGVVLFELVSGHLPFAGTLVDVCAQMAAPIHPRQACPELSLALEGVIVTCLQRDRSRRYANARELARALAPFGSGRALAHDDPTVPPPPDTSSRFPVLPSALDLAEAPTLVSPPPVRRSSHSRPAMIWGLAIAVVAAAVAAIGAAPRSPALGALRGATNGRGLVTGAIVGMPPSLPAQELGIPPAVAARVERPSAETGTAPALARRATSVLRSVPASAALPPATAAPSNPPPERTAGSPPSPAPPSAASDDWPPSTPR